MSSPASAVAAVPCWVCGATALTVIKPSNIPGNLSSDSFAITDSQYGVTTELSRCARCGFIQSTGPTDVLDFYEDLVDTGYEANRRERGLQARRILELVRRFKPGGTLLDIGAGSGILVEQALAMGYQAVGVEPSRWLQKQAEDRGLPVIPGVIPHPGVTGPFDVITLVDVIEHVNDPVGLLKTIRDLMHPDSVLVVITPDVSSFFARALGYRWWHFRAAHIGYFNGDTLTMATVRAGFREVHASRAKWYFALDYLLTRINTYLPRFLRPPVPKSLGKYTVALDLRDSLLTICKPEADSTI